MKADIAIPNPLYETSEKLAQQLGMSLSDFVLAALVAYIERYQCEDVTEQLNQVYGAEESSVDADIMSLQVASLAHETW